MPMSSGWWNFDFRSISRCFQWTSIRMVGKPQHSPAAIVVFWSLSCAANSPSVGLVSYQQKQQTAPFLLQGKHWQYNMAKYPKQCSYNSFTYFIIVLIFLFCWLPFSSVDSSCFLRSKSLQLVRKEDLTKWWTSELNSANIINSLWDVEKNTQKNAPWDWNIYLQFTVNLSQMSVDIPVSWSIPV